MVHTSLNTTGTSVSLRRPYGVAAGFETGHVRQYAPSFSSDCAWSAHRKRHADTFQLCRAPKRGPCFFFGYVLSWSLGSAPGQAVREALCLSGAGVSLRRADGVAAGFETGHVRQYASGFSSDCAWSAHRKRHADALLACLCGTPIHFSFPGLPNGGPVFLGRMCCDGIYRTSRWAGWAHKKAAPGYPGAALVLVFAGDGGKGNTASRL